MKELEIKYLGLLEVMEYMKGEKNDTKRDYKKTK